MRYLSSFSEDYRRTAVTSMTWTQRHLAAATGFNRRPNLQCTDPLSYVTTRLTGISDIPVPVQEARVDPPSLPLRGR